MTENLPNCTIQHLHSFYAKDVPVDILRLDLLHNIVSGNKWFKLKYYLEDAIATKKNTIASFGGAYSNHIVATAYAAKEAGLKSMGFIRGEKASRLSTTLLDAANYGMELVFTDRGSYRDKEEIMREKNEDGFYWINEGGYGNAGAKGAAEITSVRDTSQYTHILCAVGTGTMMAGLIQSALPGQEIIGISVLKNNMSVENEVRALLQENETTKTFSFIHDYHFGGYAKHPVELISFMKEVWAAEELPTDIVYTSKLLFAAKELLSGNRFPAGSKVLLIHSGGLQGNASLPSNTLPFS